MSKNLTQLSLRKGLDKNLFEELQDHASKDGSPSEEALRSLAKEYLMGEANLLGASSFYDFLRKENHGKQAYVCNGTACQLAGKQTEVKEKLSEHYEASAIGEVCCLGRCHENAAFQIGQVNYSGTALDYLSEIVAQPDNEHTADDCHIESFVQKTVLLQPVKNAKSVYDLFIQILSKSKDDLLNEILKTNLRGRGGAGFPIGLKMEACKAANGTQKFIVCNADEGDPGSFSDRYLLEEQAHLVLFGMLISGIICGATKGVIYLRAEYPKAITIMEAAIKEYESIRKEASIDWDFSFKIVKGAGSYVCGEETALLASIEGQRPEVRIRPPFPTEYGLFGMPTLVNNVETLANLYYIMERGANEYRSIGTEDSVGTKLICLDSFFNRPGIYEVDFGTPLKKVIDEMGLGFKTPVKALHIGGPLGGLVPKEKWDSLNIDFESFKNAGFSLGHASFIAIPEEYPMIKYLEHLFAFTAHESCGKCFPCRLGSQRGMELLQQAQGEQLRIDPELFSDLLDTLEQGSLCGLGYGLPLPVRNILTYFSDELQTYFSEKIKINTSL